MPEMWCCKRTISKEGKLGMRDLKSAFENRTLKEEQLLKYGFQKRKNQYFYQESLRNNQFQIQVEISDHQKFAKLIDVEEQEEYILVDVKDAHGSFSSQIKELYDAKIEEIIEKCSIVEIEHSSQAQDVISYIEKQYGDHLEYLWKDDFNNAVWRGKDSQKWYAILLKIKENKLGIPSNQTIEIIDLKYDKDKIEKIIDYQNIFPGYHMNKKHWITIRLNGIVPNEVLFSLIDKSYQLSQK